MERDKKQPALIELGQAVRLTLGAKGDLSDFVREIPSTGISDD
jgi:hypothetical protein